MVVAKQTPSKHFSLQIIGASVCLLICLWEIPHAARAGVARTCAEYALAANRVYGAAPAPDSLIAPANEAIRYAPRDPEAHFARARILSFAGQITDAAAAARQAVALRPDDYFLWLEYGQALETVGDKEGATAALKQAGVRAPHYAQPAWQLGNLLLRAGRTEDAFDELRRAVTSDPRLYPNLLDMAWHATGGDARRLAEAAPPRTPAESLRLTKFLIRHNETQAAMRLVRANAGTLTEADRRALLMDLLAAGNFAAAREVWAGGHGGDDSRGGSAVVTDGGYESKLPVDDIGFGWQFSKGGMGEAVKFAIDPTTLRTGTRSLRIDFAGDSPPATDLVSQLVLVEAGLRYRLSFAARTQRLVSGGLPLIRVTIAGAVGEAQPLLAQSAPLPADTSGVWRDFTIEFTTPVHASAIRFSVQRQSCGAPCPVFGQLWLDNFAIEKLTALAAGSVARINSRREVLDEQREQAAARRP